MISDVACTTLRHTTMFSYSHANTPLGQSERGYYLSYFIIDDTTQTIPLTLITIATDHRDQLKKSVLEVLKDYSRDKLFFFWCHLALMNVLVGNILVEI